ncbi:hypothetical protein J437_LFUL013048, partial [Ladona fulva]
MEVILLGSVNQTLKMFSRPNPGETEEDLLKLESEYLGKVINPKVKPAVPEDKDQSEKKPSDNIVREPSDLLSLPEEIHIREKSVSNFRQGSTCIPLPTGSSRGFPEPFVRDKM